MHLVTVTKSLANVLTAVSMCYLMRGTQLLDFGSQPAELPAGLYLLLGLKINVLGFLIFSPPNPFSP